MPLHRVSRLVALPRQRRFAAVAAGVDGRERVDRIGYYEILRSCLAPSFLKLAEVAVSLENTRFYQEFVERLKTEGEQMVRQAQLLRTISRLLGRRLALPGPEGLAKMETLPIETLELLAEDLLDFNSPADLDAWLAQK